MKIWFLILISILISVSLENTNPNSLKPDAVSPELWCVACIVLANETVKMLNGRKGESDVYHALENVCKKEYNYYRNSIF